MRDEEVTLAEVLSNAGYATAFHGKWHLGDIEESYPHNQGFDEAFFTGYNQILSLWTRTGETGNGTMGLYEDMLPPDPYKLDDTFITKDWVQVAEAKKGEKARQVGRQHPRQLPEDRCRGTAADLRVHRTQRQSRQTLLHCQLADAEHFPSQHEEVFDLQKQFAGRVSSATSIPSSAN